MVSNALTIGDFDRILDGYAGRQVTHIPVTRTTSNVYGKESFTNGNPITLKAYFMRTMQTWDYEKAGFLENGDAVMLSKYADSVQKNDLIYTDGFGLSISSIDGDASEITVSTSTVHGLSSGDEIIITNTTNYDGLYTIASITDTDTFVITDSNHNLAAETSGSVIKDYNKFLVKERFDVPGVFDSTGEATSYVYTACNLFLTN